MKASSRKSEILWIEFSIKCFRDATLVNNNAKNVGCFTCTHKSIDNIILFSPGKAGLLIRKWVNPHRQSVCRLHGTVALENLCMMIRR